MYGHEQFREDMSRPVVFVRPQSREVLLMQFRAIAFHTGVFVYWLIASHLLVDMFLYLGAAMWALGAIATIALPNERENIIRRTQYFITAYSSLVGFKVFTFFINNIPLSEWGRALGVSLHDAFGMTAMNYIEVMFFILAFGIPASYFIYIGQLFFTFRSNVDIRVRTQQIIRTGEQRSVEQRRRTRQRARLMEEVFQDVPPPPPNGEKQRIRRRI